MTTKRTLMTTACFASVCGAMYGQTGEKTAAFQYFSTSDAGAAKIAFAYNTEGNNKAVTGKPFSGTEERETIQILGDGTRIDKKDTNKYFRDAQGRTRIERDNGATIVITDPSNGSTVEMNTTNKTARKMMVTVRSTSTTGPNIIAMDKLKAEMEMKTMAMAGGQANTMVFTTHTDGAVITKEARSSAPAEDLGTQIVNAVPAKGSRSTITIPAGQIGNDREIKIVSERWVSDDLGMLVKSSNNDPRFGETTYQLINIIQGAQDPSLFQIPSDFSVTGLR